MSLLAIAKRFGTHTAGGLLACVLLLPLPAFAFTISGWQFTDNGVALQDNSSNHQTLTFATNAGGSNYSGTAESNISGSPGEPVQMFIDLSGLTFIRGSVTVTLAINDVGSQGRVISISDFQGYVSSGTLTAGSPLNLTGNSGEQITLTVQFSSNALFTYDSSTPGNFYFRN